MMRSIKRFCTYLCTYILYLCIIKPYNINLINDVGVHTIKKVEKKCEFTSVFARSTKLFIDSTCVHRFFDFDFIFIYIAFNTILLQFF